ncbi:MAG TPA: response regulator transcription factor [Anaeromyxobacter sp.]|nr:response regulator transcription factor [Anaeromyxobacter sp.]
MEPLPVLVVSPDPLARAGLAALVAASEGLSLAGAVGPGEAAAEASRREPRAVVWEVGPGAISPAAERLRELGAPVVALAADPGQAGEALGAGARGVLPRGAGAPALAAAVAAVAQGLLVLDPALAGGLVRAPAPRGEAEPLTPREREVLALLSQGLANKAIAASLGISEHTAKFHVNAILGKLGVDSRAEAIVRAARLGLVVL